jgi:AraC family transcriptional regulator, positive regulator of tynA and feaB
MQRLFSGEGKPAPEAIKLWSEMTRREFYSGDLGGCPRDFSGVVFEKALQQPISLTHLISRAPLSYRRTVRHIRLNRVGFRVIWFVKQGSLKIRRAEGDCIIKANELGMIDSNSPFFASLQTEQDPTHESYQAIVPPDLFVAHLHEAQRLNSSYSLSSPEGRIARRLLDVIVDEGERLAGHTATLVVASLLEAVGDMVRAQCSVLPEHQGLADRRLQDIKSYILLNITDPELRYEKVAACCGISPRYLSYVLKANNTTFSDLLWKNRLPKARERLVDPSTRKYPINQIAYMCGFKSAAHFSRMFKSNYGCTPRQYRVTYGGRSIAAGGRTGSGSARQRKALATDSMPVEVHLPGVCLPQPGEC